MSCSFSPMINNMLEGSSTVHTHLHSGATGANSKLIDGKAGSAVDRSAAATGVILQHVDGI